MSYKLEETAPPQTELISSFESFLIRVDFKIDLQGTLECIGQATVALFQSRDSHATGVGEVGIDAALTYRDFSISDLGGAGKLGLQLRCIEERTLDIHNEVARLSILESPMMAPTTPPGWATLGGWTQLLPHLGPNQDGTPDRRRKVSFGDVSERQAHAVAETIDSKGTRSIQVVTPLLSDPILGEVLRMHGNSVTAQPLKLSASWHGQPVGSWTYPPQAQPPIPGAVWGSVLVLQGIFKKCLVGDLAQWGATGQGPQVPLALAPQLWELALCAGRSLESVDETQQNTVVPPSPDPPVEVLMLDDLNSAAATPLDTLY